MQINSENPHKKFHFLTKVSVLMQLLPGYRGLVIDNLANLIALDDRVISREERIASQDFKLYAGI